MVVARRIPRPAAIRESRKQTFERLIGTRPKLVLLLLPTWRQLGLDEGLTMAKQKATNVTWQDGEISREDRFKLLRQKGATIWFTGLSGSGKSTIAVALEKALFDGGKLSYRLDGDNVRLGINKNLGFSEQDRRENIRRIGEIAKLFGDAGTIALSSFISPYKEDRDEVRRLHE